MRQDEELDSPSADQRDQRGASAVEYGLLVAGIAAIIAVIVFALGGPTLGMYKNTCDKWSAQQEQDDCPSQ
ncbi:MAG: Flp family type IVb pilin [Nocardioidaceae bacterium]